MVYFLIRTQIKNVVCTKDDLILRFILLIGQLHWIQENNNNFGPEYHLLWRKALIKSAQMILYFVCTAKLRRHCYELSS